MMAKSHSRYLPAPIAPLWLRCCFGGLRPTTGGGGRRWEPQPREPSSHRHSYLRLQLVQGGSGLMPFLEFCFCFCIVLLFVFFFPCSLLSPYRKPQVLFLGIQLVQDGSDFCCFGIAFALVCICASSAFSYLYSSDCIFECLCVCSLLYLLCF